VRFWTDCWGAHIRVTDERLEHILEHPEMRDQEERIAETVARPERVVRSRSDPDVRLYYRTYVTDLVGEKYLCAVIKWLPEDRFLITAHFTDRIRRGDDLWPTQ